MFLTTRSPCTRLICLSHLGWINGDDLITYLSRWPVTGEGYKWKYLRHVMCQVKDYLAYGQRYFPGLGKGASKALPAGLLRALAKFAADAPTFAHDASCSLLECHLL